MCMAKVNQKLKVSTAFVVGTFLFAKIKNYRHTKYPKYKFQYNYIKYGGYINGQAKIL